MENEKDLEVSQEVNVALDTDNNTQSTTVDTTTNTQTEPTQELSEQQIRIENAKKEAKWYVLHTFSGYENVAKENLEIVIDKYNLQERIFDIVIPMEDVVEEKDGKRKVVSRKLMPGYIYVKMIYGDDIWHAVTRTRGITGFAGPKGRPLSLTEDETLRMHLEKVTVINVDLAENDKVEVLDGPLNGFVGTVVGIDTQANKCRVIVEMFGRETPVDLGLDQVKKIN
ncbi:MAG: transcription termination/antitermination protein NusG [Firmicutes bacterium]|nr:transcription termination/antitermination protein NusG [Bacillota bacterium]MDY5041683.1 transcription termination/antitermination protein NusG [Eubacteriales bacterium]